MVHHLALRTDMSTDTVSRFLTTVDQMPFTEVTHAQRNAIATDAHTTKIFNDGTLNGGQLQQFWITDKR